MKYFNWDNEKNERLKSERNISFEEVVFFIEKGGLLDRVKHPNQKKYAGQGMFIVLMNDYVYLVQFVESEDNIFLKTIIPGRKATRDYLGKKGA
jgi:uncharacterized DUF497 family protein